MRSDERGSPIRSDSHAESHRNDRGFLRRGEDLSPAPTWPPASASGVDSNFVAAFFASSRLNVFDSWRDLPRLATTVCLPGSVGDLLTAVLAFVAIFFVCRNSTYARPLVWVFNVFGSIDLVDAITLATIYNAPQFMGPAYWIPAFWVPALLVTHYITFIILTKHWSRVGDETPRAA
jgi:hypothetical protein